ncbi:hypothetical protein [Halomontanus rarus]|uniref:hypothetical protein n=1 Tax=Halomontanus rarus TaxID=3034020 RepID=UPI0023E7BBF3|nr:hypothetical protein [Halovivax sp. TS33]
MPEDFGPKGDGNAGPGGTAEIHAFARYDGDGNEGPFLNSPPGEGLDADEVDATAVLYVGHYGDAIDEVEYERCYEAFEVNTVDTTDDSSILLDIDWSDRTLRSSDSDGSNDDDVTATWYCFGGTLAVSGDEGAQTVDYRAFYENFEWLLWKLRLCAAAADDGNVVTNPRVESG